MYALERFLIASRLAIPDQVPACPYVTGHYVLWFAGIEDRAIQYWGQNYKIKVEAQLKTIQAFPGVMLWPGIWPDFGPVLEPSALGCEIFFPERSSPVSRPVVKNPDEVDSLPTPDPSRDGLMPLALEARAYINRILPSKLKEEYGYGRWVLCTGPFDIAGHIVGYDKLIIWMYKYPDVVHKLMKKALETAIVWGKAQRDAIGSDLLTIISGDTDLFLNPSQFETFSLPYLKKVCQEFRRKENVVLYHCDGDTTHLLDKLKNLGANMFNYGQNMNTALVKRKVGDRMCLVGGLNSLGVMLNGRASEVEEASRKAISEGGPGGFVLSNEGGMAARTPLENINAMIKAAERYERH